METLKLLFFHLSYFYVSSFRQRIESIVIGFYEMNSIKRIYEKLNDKKENLL